jgi:hypothetical protein
MAGQQKLEIYHDTLDVQLPRSFKESIPIFGYYPAASSPNIDPLASADV